MIVYVVTDDVKKVELGRLLSRSTGDALKLARSAEFWPNAGRLKVESYDSWKARQNV